MRIKKLQKLLSQFQVEALLISSPVDLFYLTGMKFSKGTLIISKKSADLFVDGRYFEAAKKEFTGTTHLDKNGAIGPFLQRFTSIGIDADFEIVSGFEKLQRYAPKAKFVSLSKPVHELRIVKDKAELKKLEKACALCVKGFDFVVNNLKAGISERELATKLEIFFREHGGHGCGFEPIIAFGKNSAFPHHRAGATKLKKNDLVLIDIGVIVDDYHSDMTRVVHFGKVDPQLIKIGKIVQKAQAAAAAACKAGVSSARLYDIAYDIIEKAGFGAQFTHGLGHGVGLDIHELPILKNDPALPDRLLEEGMVVTIEPGIYLPGLGGVRIEDTLIVGKKGAKNLIEREHGPTVVTPSVRGKDLRSPSS